MISLLRAALLASFFGLLLSAAAHAQDYPTRPVTVVIPFGTGSTPDITGRFYSGELSKHLGQQFIVENRPGVVGMRAVKLATPNGLTLLWDSSGATSRQVLLKNPDFDIRADFSPITTVLRDGGGLGFFVLPSSPFRSMKDMIDFAKKNPGKLNYGSGGVGSSSHLVVELFNNVAGINVVHVPYKGGPATLAALLSGDIQFTLFDVAQLLAQGDRYRLLAVTTKQRSSFFPNVSTVAESGGPEFEAGFWMGVFAPAGTPQPVVTKLNSSLRDILQTPQSTDFLKKFVYRSAWMTPEDFKRLVAVEVEQWAKAVQLAKVPLTD